MALPVPNLDDRRFQDLVDDAKRLVQQRCPEWTDHNVSDPGVTLIETFAFMVDQLLYRLNRVPDRNYVKFLDLIGVRLFPPVAARAPVTFWLSAPQAEVIRIPAGTEVATVRTEVEDAIVFTVGDDLDIVPCELTFLRSQPVGGTFRDHSEPLHGGPAAPCFSALPQPGDALYIGLSGPVPRCAVALRFKCRIEGVGVDPLDPPLRWEAFDGNEWARCELERDDTGGLNRPGDVIVHVPGSHVASVVDQERAGWLRAVVTEAVAGQPAYSSSPQVADLKAFTVGGTATASHAKTVEREILGTSSGAPGQRMQVKEPPVLGGGDPAVIEVSDGEGWEEWAEVEGFADSGPTDKHFVFDRRIGELVFGPAVRQEDGSVAQYGAAPPKGAVVRARSYRTGGGSRGNVARGAISVPRSSIRYVNRVVNRRPASGGVDGETLEEAKVRGPVQMRARNRAVTAQDYEQLAREAAPEVARVRCVPAGPVGEATAAGGFPGVRVLVVPACAGDDTGRLRFEQLVLEEELLRRIADYLDERRVIGARIVVEPPHYQGITLVARIRARRRARMAEVETAARRALYRYYDPIVGGPDGDGWPFGRPVHVGEVYAVMQRVEGVEYIEDVRLFATDPLTGQRGEATQRLELAAGSLVFSYEHHVRVDVS
jgi:predicted phage baseplate assembly protein